MSISHNILQLAAPSASHFALNATGDVWTLSNNVIPTNGIGYIVSITNNTANGHETKTATITGLDENLKQQTEVVTLPVGGATVRSTGYYQQLISVVPSATIGADTMNIGFINQAASRTFPLNTASRTGNSVTLGCLVSGALTYTVQETTCDIQTPANNIGGNIVWINFPNTAVVGATTSMHVAYDIAKPLAIRTLFTTYTADAMFQLNLIQ